MERIFLIAEFCNVYSCSVATMTRVSRELLSWGSRLFHRRVAITPQSVDSIALPESFLVELRCSTSI